MYKPTRHSAARVVVLATGLLLVSTSLATIDATPAFAADATISLDSTVRYQTMDGFGTQINATSGSNPSLANMNSTQREEIYDLLFSTTSGAGFSMLRLEAGSGFNYSSAGFTIQPTSPGSATSTPSYTWDGSADDLVEFATEAQERGTTGFYLDSWSAPAYMKEDGKITGDAHLCGLGATCSSGDWREAYADYLAQYIAYWGTEGIPISWVNPMNEPEIQSPYQGMNISASQAVDLIGVLRDKLDARGYTGVKVACCDSSTMAQANAYMSTILGSPAAVADLGVITVHGYDGAVTSVTPSKPTWMSEFSYIDSEAFNTSYTSGVARAQNTSDRIIAALQGNVSAYFDFVGNLDESAGYPFPNQTLIANTSTSSYVVSKRLWAYANYSRFIRPGAVRFGTSSSDADISSVAFENTNGSNVVVLNSHNTASTSTSISGVTGGTYVTYVTDDSSNLVSSSSTSVGSSGSIEITVPANSTVTVVFTGTTVAGSCTIQPTSVAMNASPFSGYGADQAFDGNLTTYAQANSATTWDLTADLGYDRALAGVVFTPDTVTYASQYTIQTATAAAPSTWTTVATESSGTGTVETYTFSSTARYVRLHVTGQQVGGNWGHAVREFEIFGCAPEEDPEGLTQRVVSSADMDSTPYGGGYGADKTIDGDPVSYAHTPGHNWTLSLDLGSNQTVSRVIFDPDALNYAVGYTIQYSTAAAPSTWTTAATETAGDGSVQTYDFAAVTARYLRVVVTSENITGSWGHAVNEVSVWG